MKNKIPESVIMEFKPCPLGCESVDELVFIGRDRLHDLPGDFSVVSCGKCRLIRTNPRPTPESIGFYYPDSYGPYNHTKVKLESSRKTILEHFKYFTCRLFRFNTKRLPKKTPGSMLEIGCASGGFLHEMSQKGWEVSGIEFSPLAAENARKLGYTIHVGTVESAPEPDKKYDLVVGWMVIEHLHDPISALRKLNRYIKTDGYLVISVPNAGALECRVFADAWYGTQLPNHLYHFTTKSLQAVLLDAGWNMEKVFHQRVLSSLIPSMGYALLDKGIFKVVAKKLINMPSNGHKWNYILFPIAYVFSLFGQTGRMTIWATKAK